MSRPPALVVRAPGTNRDSDIAYALRLAGADPSVVLIGDLTDRPELLDDARLAVFAGGFSYADAIGAGRLIALDIRLALIDQLNAFVAAGRPVIGICNGFQALVAAGLLPGAGRQAALAPNATGRFECSWVTLETPPSKSIWTHGLDEWIECPIAHGEGRFTCDDATLAELRANGQIALTYHGRNPNGSVGDIAGVCDETGLVLGLMPHPENHVIARQHPQYSRGHSGCSGLAMIEAGVRHAKGL